MSCIGNLIWIFLGGFWNLITWTFVGILWCVTIIGIPIGLQCFKMARITFAPFGKEIHREKNSFKTIINIIWIVLGGFQLAIMHLISAFLLAITIVGIPFAIQQLKFAELALMPFGARIIKKY